MENAIETQEQARLWNGSAGQAWAELQELLDQVFAPFEPLLAGAVTDSERRLLDIGCGSGAVTLALARRLGAGGDCLGVDIAQPLIELARRRARGSGLNAAFAQADAATYPFAPARADRIVSRFGVMFFADPVAAFANLRRAARRGAGLDAIVWRAPEDNPFMTTAERAARPLLALPERQPDEPGQFAFARRERVERILTDSGWSDIAIEPLDVGCGFPERELVRYLSRMGPVGRVLADADEGTREKLVPRIRTAFDSYVEGDEVRFVAACWRVRAVA